MNTFIRTESQENKCEFLIDTKVFSQDIVMKAAYNFLDRGYFFFQYETTETLLLQLTSREENKENIENIIADFSDELLAVSLRDKLEKENKIIRETIVTKAINGPLDMNNFVSLDLDGKENNQEQNQIDFDKDIDDILKEIENDPDLKIDEEEIEKILKEIEEETQNNKPTITVDPSAIAKAKEQFKK